MSASTVEVVARGAWWREGPWEVFRPLAIDGSSWDVESGAAVLSADARAALLAVIDDAPRRGRGRSVLRTTHGGRWSSSSNEDRKTDTPRLIVELTQHELATILGGNMDRAVYTRLQRAEAAGVGAPSAFRDPLPTRCRVSMRGRHGAARGVAAPAAAPAPAAAAAPPVAAPAAILRPNGERYYPRSLPNWSGTDVEMVRAMHEAKRSVLLYGQPGTGKTALLEAALPSFKLVAGSSDTVVDDFVGGFVPDPSGAVPYRWVDGPLLEAMEEGAPLIIDECALIDPRVLSVVYSSMDGRGIIEVTQNPLRGEVKARPGFCIHGACNPDAPGANLSEALLSRMTLQVEYGTDYALAERLGAPKRLVTAARNLDKKRTEGELSWSPQMRELLGFVTVAKLLGPGVAHANLVSSAPAMDRPLVADVLSRSTGSPVAALRVGEDEGTVTP